MTDTRRCPYCHKSVKLTCRHCGNADRDHFEDNASRGWDLTFLCTAPVEPGAESFDAELVAGDPELRGVCGYQFDVLEELVEQCGCASDQRARDPLAATHA